MKKIVFIITVLLIIVFAGYHLMIFLTHYNIQTRTSTSNVSETKYIVAENSDFAIKESFSLSENSDSQVSVVILTIIDKTTGNKVFEVSPCRAMDYKGTRFIKKSNDFIVESGDVGCIVYKYVDDSWIMDE